MRAMTKGTQEVEGTGLSDCLDVQVRMKESGQDDFQLSKLGDIMTKNVGLGQEGEKKTMLSLDCACGIPKGVTMGYVSPRKDVL